jgi:hypothetical protein
MSFRLSYAEQPINPPGFKGIFGRGGFMKGLSRVAFLLFCSTAPGWTQSSTSTVHGSVRDSSGAVIPAAAVTLTDTATGVQRKTVANGAGLFVFPGVIPGPYRVSVEAPGMQRFEGTLTVQVQVDAEVNAVLAVGQSTTTVQVMDVTPMVQTDSPTLGHVLETQRIQELPVNGRGYQNLLVTVPNVTWSSQGFGIGALVQAYGLRPGTTTLTFDGAAQNEVWEGWDVARTPDLDTIQEMQVETNNSSAKFTRPTTIVMSSKSGTNQLHGGLFYTNRNSGYGVARMRQDTFVKAPYLNRNEWGESLGGPVYLPKIYNGHNRTFFFFSWEDIRSLQYSTSQQSFPTAAMRNGDFRGITDSLGRPYNFYDPYTTTATYSRSPLSCNDIVNMICPSRASTVAKYLFSITPMPNLSNVNPLVGQNWIGQIPRTLNQEVKTARVDHRFSSADLLYGRFSYGHHHESYQSGGPEMLNGISGVDQRWWPDVSASINEVHTFSSTLTNELLISGTRDFQRRGSGDFQTNYAQTLLGLPNPFQGANWPSISGTDLSGYSFGGEYFYLITNVFSVQDNATEVKGKHEFQFGFQYRYEAVPKSVLPTSGGYDFGTQATALYDPSSTAASPQALPLTGLGVANMYLGSMNYGATFARPWVYMMRQEDAVYFQDNWKPSSRLTLNLGLRWEYRTPLSDRQSALMGFDLKNRAYVLGTPLSRFEALGDTLPSLVTALQNFGGSVETNQQAGLPSTLVYRNFSNFGPRLGFAYRVGDGRKSFVLRGGYRVSYYTEPIEDYFNAQQSAELVSATFQNSVSNTTLSPDGLPNYGLRSVPQYVAGVNTPDSIINLNDTRLITPGFAAYFLDPHQADPRVQDWNFTIEKEIMANTIVRASYVSNHVSRMMQQINFNDSTPTYIWYATQKQPLPTGLYSAVGTTPWGNQVWGGVYEYSPIGHSNYNGVNLEFERRFSHGLAVQAFWSLANVLTEVTSGSGSTSSIPTLNAYLPGAVPTDQDARDRFLNYQRYTTVPHQQIRYNWVWELPVGKGKALAGNAHGVLDKAIGGWQIAGTGQWRTNYSTLSTSYYPTGTSLQEYGYQYPVQDCRSGICLPAYLYYNGYISPPQINQHNAAGQCIGVCGVPSDYKPAVSPLVPYGATSAPNAPAGTNFSSYYDTNTVWIPLSNGTVQRTTYNNNLNPLRNQYIQGPNQWFLDASLFKSFQIKERVRFRINIDFFNALNNPNNPITLTSDGLLSVRNSGSAARVTQLSGHLNW